MSEQRNHDNNFNLIRLLAAVQVLIVHGINHFEITGWGLDAFKAIPGVPTFFLISGYLIGSSYARAGHADLRQFFRNRFLRIYPGLWACVLVATGAVLASGYLAGRDVAPARFLAWMLAQASIVQFYNPEFMRQFGAGVLNGALWTITVELQFYLLVPLLFALLRRARAAFGVLLLLSVGLNLVLHHGPYENSMLHKLVYVTFLPWVYIFMLGFVVACHRQLLEQVRRVPYWLLVPAYLAATHLIGSYKVNASNAINPVAVLLLAMLVLKFGTARLQLPPRLAGLVRRTDFSYGLYLYHMPVINVLLYAALFPARLNLLLALLVSAALAIASWYAIEQPALRRKQVTG